MNLLLPTCLALLGAAPSAPAEPRLHTFGVLGVPSPGQDARGAVRCVYGRHAAGVPVALLPARDDAVCSLTTGVAGDAVTGLSPCTFLHGARTCSDPSGLAVVDARGLDFRRHAAEPIRDPARLRALGEAIARSGVVAQAVERWRARKMLQDGQDVGTSPVEAVRFPGLPSQLTLVKLPVSSAVPGAGPWLAIEQGKPATIFGPFSHGAPVAFTLDGAGYLHVVSATCTDCGDVQDDVYAVEAGRLRPTFHSADRGT